jgi:hypothetical protein
LEEVRGGDLEKFKDKLANANIADLTATYIRQQRKIVPAGKSITVSLEAVLNPEKTQSDVAEQESNHKKSLIRKQWYPIEIGDVTFGSTVSAKKNNADQYSVTLPQEGIQNGEPVTNETRKLQQAMRSLPNAKEITIGADSEHLTLDLITKSILIPVNGPLIEDSMNRGFSHSHLRLEKVVFAKPAELPVNVMQGKFDNGTLLLSAHPSRTQALEHLNALNPYLDAAKNGDVFTFKEGNWQPPSTPIPVI